MQKTLLRLAIAVAAFCLLPGVAMAETPSTSPAAGASASGAPNSPTPTPTPTPQAAAAPKLVRARVLTDCEHGKANDVVDLPPDAAKGGVAAGVLDTTKAAVDYAASLEQNKPKPKDS